MTLARFPGPLTLPSHIHDRTLVGVTLWGRFDSVMWGRAYDLRPGTVHTEPAGERHSNRFSTRGAHVLIVQPDPSKRDVLRSCARFLDGINCFADRAAAAIAARLARELTTPDAVSPLAIEALSLELLAIGARAGQSAARDLRPPAWIGRVRDLLHASFAQPLHLAAIASVAGLHPAHVTRVFRRYHGVSIGEYVRRLRLDWAAAQLTDTSRAISEIAVAAGFADQSHFTRRFARQFGRTPAVFRRECTRTPRQPAPR
ncbi:MAG: AraC family transcriptional regulator [Vicinamibacterales bacterium]